MYKLEREMRNAQEPRVNEDCFGLDVQMAVRNKQWEMTSIFFLQSEISEVKCMGGTVPVA